MYWIPVKDLDKYKAFPSFLNELPNLKILEIREVRLTDLEGVEKLVGLDQLTIWTN